MISERNIIQHELIGLKAEVSASSNPLSIGIKGYIIDETNHTLLIEEDGKDKRIFKKSSNFVFNLPNKKRVEVAGTLLEGRPWGRVKKK